VLDGMRAVGPLALLLAMISLGVGYLVPRATRVARRQSIACAIGIHNSALAITVALSPALLGNPETAVPPAVYGLLMFVPAGLFGAWSARDEGLAGAGTTSR
jgi:BASS family bile acid:Na+ symporter